MDKKLLDCLTQIEAKLKELLLLERDPKPGITLKDIVPGNYFESIDGRGLPLVIVQGKWVSYGSHPDERDSQRIYCLGGLSSRNYFELFSTGNMTRPELVSYLDSHNYKLVGKIKTTIERF